MEKSSSVSAPQMWHSEPFSYFDLARSRIYFTGSLFSFFILNYSLCKINCQPLFFVGLFKTRSDLFRTNIVHIVKHLPCAMLDYVLAFLLQDLDLGPIDIGQDKIVLQCIADRPSFYHYQQRLRLVQFHPILIS